MTPQQEHLGLLAIFHYVVAGLMAVLVCPPFIQLAIGQALVLAPCTFSGNHGPPPPVFVGWLLASFAGVFTSVLLAKPEVQAVISRVPS